MPTQDLHRTFFDLPTDQNTQLETNEFLANFMPGRKVDWLTLLESDRILIVSEAGMGKTHECRYQQNQLWDAGHSSFFVELSTVAANTADWPLSPEEHQRLEAWKSAQTERAVFFLDSIDELKLTRRSFAATLKQFSTAISGHLDRACIVLTTRPTPLDLELVRRFLPVPPSREVFVPEEYFANVAMSVKEAAPKKSVPEWRFVALSPLDEHQMRLLATSTRVDDVDALITAVSQHHAHEFAKRPLDFLELCGDWKEHGRIRAHRDQVDNSIFIKLRPRQDRQEATELAPDKAREGASRLALATLLSRRWTTWHSTDSDRSRGDPALDPARVLVDWPENAVTTLLERPLFGFATYGRVRFHNRSVTEFLAAERLLFLEMRGLPTRTLMRLLFATTPEGQRIVKPSLQAVAAWLAPHLAPVCQEILEHDPSVLLRYGDPGSLDLSLRTRALERCVEKYGAGGWRGQGIPRLQAERLAMKDLDHVVERLWGHGITNPEVRETLLELIGSGQMDRCADIAYRVVTDPSNDSSDRLNGLVALARLQDSRLPETLDAIASTSPNWPETLARSTINHLFPDHLSVRQLLQLLARLSPKTREIGGISTMLPLGIESAALAAPAMLDLQRGLTELVSAGCRWYDDSYRVVSDRKDLVPALLVASRRRLETGDVDSELVGAIALAGLLAKADHHVTDELKELEAALDDASAPVRAGIFRAYDRLIRQHHPKSDSGPFYRLFQFQSHGPYQLDLQKDRTWVMDTLRDGTREQAEREVALEIALRCSKDCPDRPGWLRQVVEAVSPNEQLRTTAQEFVHSTENPAPPPKWMLEDAKRAEKIRRKRAKNLASWRLFWRELNEDPESAFSESRVENTVRNLWHVMEKDSGDHSFSGWNRGFIERVFDKAMADRFRGALVTTWRRDRPTLKSERAADERNGYPMRWHVGLAGIYAEAEDPGWIAQISAVEADLACRYALIDWYRLPPWLEAIVMKYPAVVDGTIGEELSGQLEDSASRHSMILVELAQASPSVASQLLHRIRAWLERVLEGQLDPANEEKVGHATTFVLQHGSPADRESLRTRAQSELQQSPSPQEILFWLPILMQTDLQSFVSALERLAEPIRPARNSPVVEWVATLFSDRSETALASLRADPHLLLRVVRLANRHVRFDDDQSHEGVFSPDARDTAQRSRSVLTNALLNLTGPDGWEVKMDYACDPEVASYRDRIHAVAQDQLARDWDTVVLTEAAVVQLEREHEFAPTNRVEMAALLESRLADIEDLLLHDTSPRELWGTIGPEKFMRREIAAELQRRARGAYLVNQEAVTGDEKETDIRLCSTAAHLEAVIELKIAENGYSYPDLQDALRDQLVGKYMTPEHRRVGCLLISISKNRHWKDPVTGRQLDIEEVVDRLGDQARAMMVNLGYGALLLVRHLDLRRRC